MGTLERWVLWLCVISTLLVLGINALKRSDTPPTKKNMPMFHYYDMDEDRKVKC